MKNTGREKYIGRGKYDDDDSSSNNNNKIIGERAKQARHSLGVLNANLQNMHIRRYCTYVTSFSSVGTLLRKGGGVRPHSVCH